MKSKQIILANGKPVPLWGHIGVWLFGVLFIMAALYIPAGWDYIPGGYTNSSGTLLAQKLTFILPAAYTILYILSPRLGFYLFAPILDFAYRFLRIMWVGLTGRGHAGLNVLRGTEVVSSATLADTVKARNKAQAKAEIEIGGVPIPHDRENRGFLFAGMVGTGKSVVVDSMLSVIDKRETDRAFIADRSGEYVSRFYDQSRGDIILNPLDARSVSWSPLAEMRNDWDAETIAKSLIPDSHGDAAEFNKYAQAFAQSILLRAWDMSLNNADLYRLAVMAEVDELRELLANTPASPYLAEGNERMFGSVRSVAATYLSVLNRLNPEAGKHDFSIRDYVHGKGSGRLFFNYESDQMKPLRGLIATAADAYCGAVLTLPPAEHDRRMWLVLDEFSSLGKIDGIENFITNSRKHGGAAALGLQNISQVNALYGQENAKTILSSMGNQLILRVSDAETADVMSKTLGEQQISRMVSSSSNSTGGQSGSQSQSRSEQIQIERAVLPSEIMGLPDLSGYLKIAGDFNPALVRLTPRPRGSAREAAYMPLQRKSQPSPQRVETPREQVATGNADIDALNL